MTQTVLQTVAAVRTRPSAFQSEATAPTLSVIANALLMWKLQARRVRTLV